MDVKAEHSALVAEHYNKLQEGNLESRAQSRIFYMRNFNNWMKSLLIGEYLQNVKKNVGPDAKIQVLDMCCGKGGDLLKWKKGNVSHIVFSDIAATSVEQCESRFQDMQKRDQHQNREQRRAHFTAQFIPADLTKVRLKDQYTDREQRFELTSCQFSLHYSFESLQQAERLMQNAAESLRPGGYLIGTLPDGDEIVKRLRAAEGMEFGNEVYKISFLTEDKHKLPLFGCKYDFHLEGVVDCPEFLVHFPALERLAARYGLRCVLKESFSEFFRKRWSQIEPRKLLGRMQALEPFPADEGVKLLGASESQYGAAEAEWAKRCNNRAGDHSGHRIGTLSQDEWEAVSIYMVFAFEKVTDGVLTSDPKSSQAPEQTSEDT